MRKQIETVLTSDLIELIEELGMKEKEAQEIIGITRGQFYNWKRKGTMPAKYYWNFKNAVAVFLQEQMFKKMIRLGLLSKETLKEVMDE